MARKRIVISNIEVEAAGAEGKCIARQNGKVILLSGVAPGDNVDAKILRKKKNYLLGKPIRFHKYSKYRTEPFCGHYGICGGCKWQHLQYGMQLELKRQQVIDSLERIGKLELPEVAETIPSEKTQFYRNKLEFTFSDQKWLTDEEIRSGDKIPREGLGFHIPGRFDRIVDLEKCYLQDDPSNEVRNRLKQFAIEEGLSFFDLNTQSGLLRNLIIRTSNTGQSMAIVQFAKESEDVLKVMEFLKHEFPAITSLKYLINTKGNDSYYDLVPRHYAGSGFIVEKIPAGSFELSLRIGAKSFYQTNSTQAINLYRKIAELAGLTGKEIVYDLYSGIGSIALFLAPNAEKVFGMEYIDEAVENARKNAEINHIYNTEFICGDIKDLLANNGISLPLPDLIVTDPPRAGMHSEVLKNLLELSPEKIIYVSCNPTTQARDLSVLGEKYLVMNVQPIDMFPHTHHVENIVVLSKKNEIYE